MTNEEAKVFLDNLKVCIDEHPVVADWLVEIADRKTENSSEIPNNCETCRHKGEEGCEQPCLGCGCCGLYEPKDEPTGYNLSPVDKDINVRSKDEPQPDAKCKDCKWWNKSYVCHWKEGVCHYVPKAIIPKQCLSCDSASRIIEAYSRGFEDGAKAVKSIKVKALHKDYIEPYVTIEDEPQIDGILFKGNLKEGDYKLIKTTNGWVLEGNDIAYYGEPQTDCPWK